jgi:hypothetical protein
MRPRVLVLLFSFVMQWHVMSVASGMAFASESATCTPDSVGVDISLGTAEGELILGMAWGQSFTATDT